MVTPYQFSSHHPSSEPPLAVLIVIGVPKLEELPITKQETTHWPPVAQGVLRRPASSPEGWQRGIEPGRVHCVPDI